MHSRNDGHYNPRYLADRRLRKASARRLAAVRLATLPPAALGVLMIAEQVSSTYPIPILVFVGMLLIIPNLVAWGVRL